jgi:hypothetical protein
MNSIDICYTPLNLPEVPPFDSDALYAWISAVYAARPYKDDPKENATLSEKTLEKKYPWKKVYAYFYESGWQSNFDTLFPELAKYLFDVYDIPIENIREITLLPNKEEVRGSAFWHADLDPLGLRFYLVNDKYKENPLYYRKTKLPYDTKQQFTPVVLDSDPMFEDEMILCKPVKETQGFYLNNIRGVHNYYINDVPTKRIAVVVKTFNHSPEILNKINKLIVDSAECYKEYAILY